MFNIGRFDEILTQFKKDFRGEHWENEQYKSLIIARMNNDIFDSELQKTFLLKMSLTYSPGVFPVLFLKTRLK